MAPLAKKVTDPWSGLSLPLNHSIRCGATTNFNAKCLVYTSGSQPPVRVYFFGGSQNNLVFF